MENRLFFLSSKEKIELKRGETLCVFSKDEFVLQSLFLSLKSGNNFLLVDENGEKLSSRDIAFMGFDGPIFVDLSVYDNLAFSLKKDRKINASSIVLDMARFLNIESLLNKKAKDLSSLEKGKVALGKRFIVDAPLFVCFDPLRNRKELEKDYIALLKKKNARVLFLTNNPKTALVISNEMIVNYGTIDERSGYPLSLYFDPPTLKTLQSLSNPKANVIQLEKDNDSIFFLGEKINVPFSSCCLVIHPHDVILNKSGRFIGAVLFLETIGNHKYLHLETHRQEIVVEWNGGDVKIGERLNFNISLKKSYLFLENGERVRIKSR